MSVVEPSGASIDPGRPLHESLRRLMRAHLDLALAALGDLPASLDDAGRAERVRRARKSVKRLRAMLPMVGARGEDPRRAALRFALRDAGRRLSSARDRHVRRETLGRLARRMRPDLSEHARDALDRLLDLSVSDASRPARSEEDAVALAAAEDLRCARLLLAGMPLPQARWSELRRLVSRRWSATRRRLRQALAAGDDHRLHEVRKACGRLETILLVVEPLDRPRLAPRRRRTSRIYEDLGLDRDLMLLGEWLDSLHELEPGIADPLREAIISLRGRTHRRLARRIRLMPRAGAGRWRMIRRRRPDPPAPGSFDPAADDHQPPQGTCS